MKTYISITTKGFTLIEIIVAMGLMTILIPAIMTGFVTSQEGRPMRENRVHATGLLKEAEEALRSAREKSWNNIKTGGLYHPVDSGSYWSLSSGTEIVDSHYTRQILIEDIQRDSNGNIVSSGGTYDPSTKKATITVAWTQPRNDFLQSQVYLTRHVGNTAIVHTTVSDFSGGQNNGTEVVSSGDGAVRLIPPTSAMSYTDNYTNPANYSYDSNKIQVTGGVAQLRGSTGPSGSTTNSGFDSVLTPWTLVSYGDNPAPSLTRVATGGNPGGFGQLNFASARNKITQGYMYQSFSVTGAGATGLLSFDKKVHAYQATPDDFRLRVYLDTSTGGPTNLIWDSGSIVSTSPWSSTLNLNITPYISAPATYYLKLGAYVDFPSANRGPYTLGYDNIFLNWSTSGTYPTDGPSISWSYSTSPSGITQWTGFSSVENTNGGSIRYQLSNDGGTTWLYHVGSTWTTAGSGQYNSASELNSNISTFPVGGGSMRVKAFLISNGTQLVQLDSVTLTYLASGGGSSGNYISPVIDAGSESGFNRIIWSDTNTSNTTTKFQIATNNDNATWNFVGPDGSASTYFTNNQGKINLSNVLGRYFKYKIYFTTTNSDVPSVESVNVNYSP